jgi:coenzyme F420-reducing hydrogenase gamma subunit
MHTIGWSKTRRGEMTKIVGCTYNSDRIAKVITLRFESDSGTTVGEQLRLFLSFDEAQTVYEQLEKLLCSR